MANFILCVDSDAVRRRKFIEAVDEPLHLLPGLRGGHCASGAFACAWAASRNAPVTSASDADGAAIVWGLPFHTHVDGAVDSTRLRTIWSRVHEQVPEALDGYHAAVRFAPDGALVMGADILGLYPIYYWSDGDVLLAGSSAALFRYHPRFNVELDVDGLVAILLTMTAFGGRTLFRGVTRLQPGNLLVRSAQGEVRERMQYRVPLSDDSYGLPFETIAGRFDELLDDAVRRHVSASRQHMLLLSGGLDSRTLAGYLHRQGHRPVALTFGAPHENEMRIATEVARVSGFPQRQVPLSFDRHSDWAKHHARWMHLSGGFHSFEYWQVHDALADTCPWMVSGYLGDPIIGGSHAAYLARGRTDAPELGRYFERIADTAIPAPRVASLLRVPRAGARVEDATAAVRECAAAYSDRPYFAAYVYHLYHRSRLHAGSVPFIKCFGSWPILPLVDRRVLAFIGGCPPAAVSDRQLETALIVRQFPALAEIEVDRNSLDTHPLLPSLRYELRKRVEWRSKRLRRALRVEGPARDPRYYVGTFNYNSDGWRSVRRLVAPLIAKRASAVLDPTEVERYVGGPEDDVAQADPILSTSGHKLLLGFVLWAEHNL